MSCRGTRLLALGAAVLCAAPTVACTSSHSADQPSSAPSAAVTRWWSAGGHSAGSTIDPNHPAAGADALLPSRSTYCAMLRDTLAAGASIVPSTARAGAGGPASLAGTEAFVAEIQHVAPAPIASSWRLVGNALTAFMRSDGKSMGAANSAQITRAAAKISADAKTHCGLDLSASSS